MSATASLTPSSLRLKASEGRLTVCGAGSSTESLSLHCITRHPRFALLLQVRCALSLTFTSVTRCASSPHFAIVPSPRLEKICADGKLEGDNIRDRNLLHTIGSYRTLTLHIPRGERGQSKNERQRNGGSSRTNRGQKRPLHPLNHSFFVLCKFQLRD